MRFLRYICWLWFHTIVETSEWTGKCKFCGKGYFIDPHEGGYWPWPKRDDQ